LRGRDWRPVDPVRPGHADNQGTMTGALPNLIVIGAMKCGTTSLHYYLSLHPEIEMSREKELDFFIEERNWRKGLGWYRAQFAGGARVRGEASPNYTMHPLFDGVAERMHATMPDVKLIYVVRDPIERMISHYIHLCAEGAETRPAAEALLATSQNWYLDFSEYHRQVNRYLQLFPRQNLMIVAADDLLRRRGGTLRQIFEFLGVDPSFDSWRFRSTRHSSSYKRRKTEVGRRLAAAGVERLVGNLPGDLKWHARKLLYLPFSRGIERPVLPADVRTRLAERLKPDIDGLRRLAGRTFDGWSV
jgi:hypothetical protein